MFTYAHGDDLLVTQVLDDRDLTRADGLCHG